MGDFSLNKLATFNKVGSNIRLSHFCEYAGLDMQFCFQVIKPGYQQTFDKEICFEHLVNFHEPS